LSGSRYQLRFARVLPGSQANESISSHWKVQLPMLEDTSEPTPQEVSCKLHEPAAGGFYRFSVRLGDLYRWSDWSQPSEPVLISVPAPTPSPGDVLEVAFGVPLCESARLEWQSFRTASNDLTRIEYKVMAVEWPCEKLGTVDSDTLTHPSLLTHGDAQPAFRLMGYVTPKQNAGQSQLRAQTSRIDWTTEGLRPGMCYRFFVCARYAGLPAGATTLPPGIAAAFGTEPGVPLEWPDEHFNALRDDVLAWEAALSRLGLWSPVISTAHLPRSVIRPMTALSGQSARAQAALTPSIAAAAGI